MGQFPGEECRFLRPPVSGALRARACAQMGSWKEARKALEEPSAFGRAEGRSRDEVWGFFWVC